MTASKVETISLRIKSQKAPNIRMDVGGSMPLREFTAQLEALTEIPAHTMALLKGFPPKRIPFDHLGGTVNDLGLRNQETLIVERDKNVTNIKVEQDVKIEQDIKPSVPSDAVRPQAPATTHNPISTASVNSATSSASNVPEIQSTLPPYFMPSLPGGTFQDISAMPESGGVSEVPLASRRSNSNIYNSLMTEDVAPFVDTTSHGILMRHVVPADNSCLFTSVAFCLSEVEHIQDTNYLRQLIAATVESDPVKYNEAFLGRSNVDYCNWIRQPDSWGGGIEVSILSEFYGYEITVITIQSTSVSRFGEDRNYQQRMFLLYDGIHYDPLYKEIFHLSQQQKLFPVMDTETLEQALQLANEAKRAHQYTDVKNFQLRCNRCNKLLKGNTEAQQHAKTTGHVDFSEIV
jgi:ubiquitin thioesterase OTU1